MSKIAYPLRLDEELMNKLKQLSELESRSLNKQMEFIIKSYLDQYEAEHGSLSIDEQL